MATLEGFLVQFPEFSGVDADVVLVHLDAAGLEVDADVWGAKADQGIYYLCAHKLALSPMGQNARLVSEDGSTTYEKHLRKLQLQVSSGYRIT